MRQNLLVRIYYMQFGGPVVLPYVVYSANYIPPSSQNKDPERCDNFVGQDEGLKGGRANSGF